MRYRFVIELAAEVSKQCRMMAHGGHAVRLLCIDDHVAAVAVAAHCARRRAWQVPPRRSRRHCWARCPSVVAVRAWLVIARDALDVEKVVLRGHLGHQQNLDAVLFAVRRIHEQLVEIALSLAVLGGLAQNVHVLGVGAGIGKRSTDRLRTVLAILAVEQGRRVVEPGDRSAPCRSWLSSGSIR